MSFEAAIKNKCFFFFYPLLFCQAESSEGFDDFLCWKGGRQKEEYKKKGPTENKEVFFISALFLC